MITKPKTTPYKGSILTPLSIDIIDKVYNKKSTFKNTLYSSAKAKNLNEKQTKQLYAITINILKSKINLLNAEKMLYKNNKSKNVLKKFKKAELHYYLYEMFVARTKNKPKIDEELKEVFGRDEGRIREILGVANNSKPGQKRSSVNESEIESKKLKTESPESPEVQKYARINRLITKKDENLQTFIQKNFPNDHEIIKIDDQLSKNLFIIPKKLQSNFFKHKKIKSNEIIIQDKASCLPVEILFDGIDRDLENKCLGSEVCEIVDACSAPGNKTTQIAGYVRERGLENWVWVVVDFWRFCVCS